MSSSDKKRRIYTRRGDLGETSLCFGPRIGKDQLRIVTCGQVDELCSLLGVIRAEQLPKEIDALLVSIQKKLFQIETEITTYSPSRHQIQVIQWNDIQELESDIDQWAETLPELSHFILPGGCRTAALFHFARSVCRRAERHAVALIRKDESISRFVVSWLNRLSDLFFILARYENQQQGIPDEKS